ncbi:WAT1-related protein At4g15540 isoform X1 [Jatropha curcas]|uniref:WAT1-related protein At4g15540 isoform X1 n=1 Tax=Jatropha curcas TaxID=180498 RepID=UPI001893DA44|nr:WAT1-related protein At4g15540 isoform X1 [Jatropha curcas]XP_037495590.1 WAT1-related protein At4g15540 isoform X1 [Jatropha curcas]
MHFPYKGPEISHVVSIGNVHQSTREMWGLRVTAVMLTLEFLDVGLNTVNKAAMSSGFSHYILVVYSNMLAIFLLLSSSVIFYRKRIAPPLTLSILCKIFVLSLLSCAGQVFTYIGIGYSNPTLASAMIDLTPAFTFILGVISGMERLDLKSKSSQAKSIGTMMLITGGLVVTLYKGLPINKLQSQILVLPPSNWAIGGFFLAVHSFILAVIYIIQTWIIRDYPSEIIITLINCCFVTILSAIVTLIAEKDLNAWKIRPDIGLVATGFSAVFAVSLRSVVHTWACHKRGPVYTSMFKPLGMAIAVFMGVSFIGDTLYLGSVIGAVIIAFGFYAVVWGKTQEETVEDKESCRFESSSPKVPFLQNKFPTV